MSIEASTEQNVLIRTYSDYLDAELGDARKKILQLIEFNERRLLVDLNDLRSYSRELWSSLVSNPVEHIPAMEKALKATVLSIYDGRHGDYSDDEFFVGFTGNLPQNKVNPRTLMARFLGRVVVLEGIVTKCSLSRPKVRKSVHYCEKTKAFHSREYKDATMIGNELISSAVYPTEDADQNPLQTEFGMCKYSDYQTITLQEMPEKAPAGQLPRSVDVILHADLVDKLKPGDRALIYGVYKSIGGMSANNSNPTFRTIVIANNVVSLVKAVYQKPISDEDVELIRKVSQRKNVFQLLSRSLAPSIFGNEAIKKAVLLLLLGGSEKNLENGTHIRGDINMLLVGDPSTAKSQMLRFVLKMAPLAVATTGRGSSGVGLTAAVVSDKDTGERRLEAGAMVLADGGVVCIDEFDKMSDIDRVAIHEVMEQQTVTIAKAGIHTALNARCSVLAAANPQFGQYDNNLSPAVNTALPDSLISRFDLVFILLDQINPTVDRLIANHVLTIHCYRPPGLPEGEPIDDLMNTLCLDDNEEEEEDDSPFEKRLPAGSSKRRGKQVLKISFLKKYVHYAKTRIHPTLSEDACDYIGEQYVGFREKAASLAADRQTRVFPVTARSLESLIRLATAHAKARLSPMVERKDAEAAVELVNYSIFREITEMKKDLPPSSKKAKKRADDSEDEDEHSSSGREDSGDESEAEIMPKSKNRGRRTAATSSVPDMPTSSRFPAPTQTSNGLNQLLEATAMSSQMDATTLRSEPVTCSRASKVNIAISDARFETFMAHLHEIRNVHCLEGSSLKYDLLMTESTKNGFTLAEVEAALVQLQDQDLLVHADDDVYFLG